MRVHDEQRWWQVERLADVRPVGRGARPQPDVVRHQRAGTWHTEHEAEVRSTGPTQRMRMLFILIVTETSTTGETRGSRL
ncbi:hypothetical protein GCM10022243_45830 [Saccharothrix violaceirubra]